MLANHLTLNKMSVHFLTDTESNMNTNMDIITTDNNNNNNQTYKRESELEAEAPILLMKLSPREPHIQIKTEPKNIDYLTSNLQTYTTNLNKHVNSLCFPPAVAHISQIPIISTPPVLSSKPSSLLPSIITSNNNEQQTLKNSTEISPPQIQYTHATTSATGKFIVRRSNACKSHKEMKRRCPADCPFRKSTWTVMHAKKGLTNMRAKNSYGAFREQLEQHRNPASQKWQRSLRNYPPKFTTEGFDLMAM